VTRALSIIVLLSSVAHASPSSDARVAHLAAAIAQLQAIEPYAFERELYDAIRVKCGTSPKTACMIETARAACAQRGCAASADVIVTNLHAERALVDEPTRVRLVRTSTDYHAAVVAEVRKRYAILAAELVLAAPAASLAAQIDAFCVERDRVARRCAPGAPACIGSIAYQRCAAGLVWFTSTQPREVDR
jgi:hypothetical protein